MKPESGCSGTAATPCLSEHAGKEAAYETKTTRNASHGLASSRPAIVRLHGPPALKLKTRTTSASLRVSVAVY